MVKQPFVWTSEMQQYLEDNFKTIIACKIAKTLKVPRNIVYEKREELIKKQGITKLLIRGGKTFIEHSNKMPLQRPPAIYSNKSPYGIYQQGLKQL